MVKVSKDASTEEKILAAAKKVFVAKGMAGARMQDIADEAGINKALLHYYFRSKEQLFEVIFREASTRFFPRLNQVVESDLPLFEKMEAFIGHYIDMAIQNPYLPLFVLNEMNQQPAAFFQKIWAGKPPRIEILLKQIEKEIKKGTIHRVNPTHLIMNMLSLCVFPFVAKPMFQMVMHLDDARYRPLMEQRKKEVTSFIVNAIKK
jgi:TetR/AcrR family transcriptional regulator